MNFMDNKTLVYELAKKYTFENFDFTNGSPEEFFKLYQKNLDIFYNLSRQDDPTYNHAKKLLNK